MSWMMALSGSSGSSSPNARPTSVSYVAPSGALLSMTIFVTFARAAGAPAQITAAITKATRARSRARDEAFTVASSLCNRPMKYGGEGAWVDLSPHRVKPRRVDARKEMLRTIAAGYAAFAFHASRAAACSRLLSFLRWSSQMNPKRGPRDIWRHPATRQRMSSLRRLRPVWAAAPRPIRPRASRSSSLISVPTRSRSELASCSTIRSTNVWAIAPRFPHARCTPSKTKVQFRLKFRVTGRFRWRGTTLPVSLRRRTAESPSRRGFDLRPGHGSRPSRTGGTDVGARRGQRPRDGDPGAARALLRLRPRRLCAARRAWARPSRRLRRRRSTGARGRHAHGHERPRHGDAGAEGRGAGLSRQGQLRRSSAVPVDPVRHRAQEGRRPATSHGPRRAHGRARHAHRRRRPRDQQSPRLRDGKPELSFGGARHAPSVPADRGHEGDGPRRSAGIRAGPDHRARHARLQPPGRPRRAGPVTGREGPGTGGGDGGRRPAASSTDPSPGLPGAGRSPEPDPARPGLPPPPPQPGARRPPGANRGTPGTASTPAQP